MTSPKSIPPSVRHAGRVHPYEKAGRPREHKSGAADDFVTFRIPPALKVALYAEARRTDMSVSLLVRKVVMRSMKRRVSGRKAVDTDV